MEFLQIFVLFFAQKTLGMFFLSHFASKIVLPIDDERIWERSKEAKKGVSFTPKVFGLPVGILHEIHGSFA